MSELFIYYSNVSSSVSSSFMNSPIFYQTILSGFISLLVSVAVALASYYLKKFLDKRGEISIYTKIINRPNIRGWGFENRNGDFYSLFIPLKVEVINNKNIDYVLRDFSLLIDNEKMIQTESFSKTNNIEGNFKYDNKNGNFKVKQQDFTSMGKNEVYTFVVPKKSAVSYKFLYFQREILLSDFDFKRLSIRYFDINGKKCFFNFRNKEELELINKTIYQAEEDWIKLSHKY